MERKCIQCQATIPDANMVKPKKDYCNKSYFAMYRCPSCGFENERVYPTINESNIESKLRSLFFESYLRGEKLNYSDAIRKVKNWAEKYDLREESGHIDEDGLRNQVNGLFKKLEGQNFLGVRLPIDRLHDEQFDELIISTDNPLEKFFNKRFIRRWDLVHLNKDTLAEIKKRIEESKTVRFKQRWLATLDWMSATEA